MKVKVLADQEELGKDRVKVDKIDNFNDIDLPSSYREIPLYGFGFLRISNVLSVDDALRPHKANVSIGQSSQNEGHKGIEFVLVRFIILFQDGNEETLNCKSLSKRGSQINSITIEKLEFVMIMLVIFAADGPGQEKKIRDDTNDTIGHESSSEVIELDDKY